MKLHYEKHLKKFSQHLRKAGIFAEAALWNELKSDKLGYRFLRQRPIDRYIVDFYSPRLKLAIEIDGAATHDSKVIEDSLRQREIEKQGVRFVRFSDSDVQFNLPGVINIIKEEIASRGK